MARAPCASRRWCENYCLSICSADFNEWVWKNASTHIAIQYSYVWTGEYEIFEFDLGSTFNYAEMAALIAPRPFMVERGHFDGVAPDEMVGYEFAKVRRRYAADLKLPDRCEIEWFVGPHTDQRTRNVRVPPQTPAVAETLTSRCCRLLLLHHPDVAEDDRVAVPLQEQRGGVGAFVEASWRVRSAVRRRPAPSRRCARR